MQLEQALEILIQEARDDGYDLYPILKEGLGEYEAVNLPTNARPWDLAEEIVIMLVNTWGHALVDELSSRMEPFESKEDLLETYCDLWVFLSEVPGVSD